MCRSAAPHTAEERHHRLGHVREARQWLDKAVQAMDQAEKPTTPIAQPSESASAAIGPLLWNRLLTLQLLRREAEALVRAK